MQAPQYWSPSDISATGYKGLDLATNSFQSPEPDEKTARLELEVRIIEISKFSNAIITPSRVNVRKPPTSLDAAKAQSPVPSPAPSPYLDSPGFYDSNFSTPDLSRNAYFPPVSPRPSQVGYGIPLDTWRPLKQLPDVRPARGHIRAESQTDLLSDLDAERTFNAEPGYGYTPPGQGNLHSRPRLVEWYDNHWKPVWNMYAFLIVGILFAAGHHLFYHSLHGKEAKDQLRMLRYGTALAFLAKANFAATVMFAFQQRAWQTVRHKILTIGAVDSLFAAVEDLSAWLNWEVFRSAKVAMCLALYIWATPLVVILTSETLAVTPLTKREDAMCPSVRTLNFTHEETKDWRDAIAVQGLFELSVSLWNTTSDTQDANDPNSFDYWTDSSQQYSEVAWMSAYLQQTIMRKNAAQDICGVGWNCSFTIEFIGPGYKCEQLASGVDSPVKKLGDAEAPFNTSVILPYGNHSYLAIANQGDYAAQQISTGSGGHPKMKPPYPEKLGAFRTEPVLWIGYAAVDNTTKHQPENNTVDGWFDAYTPTIFGCEHYETKYKVHFNYTGGFQSHNVTERNFLNKIIDTQYTGDFDVEDGTWDNTTAVPDKNYIYPKDIRRYRRTGAYHSLGKQFRDFLNGNIRMPYYVSETKATQTRLIERHNYLPIKNFQKEVQKLYEEMILSLLSNPQFIAVSWANDPSQYSGVTVGGAETEYPCSRERTTNCYFYHAAELWSVYAVTIAIAIGALISGVLATRDEGLTRNTRFSSILAAAKGQGLDNVQWQGDRRAQDLKVGYGLVPGVAGDQVYGFGLEGDVRQAVGESITQNRTWTRLNENATGWRGKAGDWFRVVTRQR
ncbi:hypothetical protein G7046_g5733 [Stylonectria norvegica]|nr:hypothetical protein G7046_g5733 [Stylonectria norvegica]